MAQNQNIMKKMILASAAIAVTFGVLAFAPVEKSNTINNIEAFEVADLKSAFGTCSTRYKTQVTFSECDTEHYNEMAQGQFDIQAEVLNKY